MNMGGFSSFMALYSLIEGLVDFVYIYLKLFTFMRGLLYNYFKMT